MKRIRNTETGHTFDYDEKKYPKLDAVVKRGGGCAGLACESCPFFNSKSSSSSFCKSGEELGNIRNFRFANCIVEDIPIKTELRYITVEELRQLELPAKCVPTNGQTRTLLYIGKYQVMLSLESAREFSQTIRHAITHYRFHMPVVEPPKVKLTIDGIDIMISKDSADEIKKQLTKGDSNE